MVVRLLEVLVLAVAADRSVVVLKLADKDSEVLAVLEDIHHGMDRYWLEELHL